jgi:hypothetical protein
MSSEMVSQPGFITLARNRYHRQSVSQPGEARVAREFPEVTVERA